MHRVRHCGSLSPSLESHVISCLRLRVPFMEIVIIQSCLFSGGGGHGALAGNWDIAFGILASPGLAWASKGFVLALAFILLHSSGIKPELNVNLPSGQEQHSVVWKYDLSFFFVYFQRFKSLHDYDS